MRSFIHSCACVRAYVHATVHTSPPCHSMRPTYTRPIVEPCGVRLLRLPSVVGSLEETALLWYVLEYSPRDFCSSVHLQASRHIPQFDVVTAMTTLRSAGYLEDALYLSKKHAKHNWYFKLQLEDMAKYAGLLCFWQPTTTFLDSPHFNARGSRSNLSVVLMHSVVRSRAALTVSKKPSSTHFRCRSKTPDTPRRPTARCFSTTTQSVSRSW